MSTLLGLSAYYADAAAAAVVDGRFVAGVEEERFRRVKHWAGFPEQALRWCVEEAAGGDAAAVDAFAVARRPRAYLARKAWLALTHPRSLPRAAGRLENLLQIEALAGGAQLGAGDQEVDVETLDENLESEEIATLRLLKIDVEGAEANVIAGARALLSRRPRPSLYIATHGRKAYATALERLADFNFGRLEVEMDEDSGNGSIRVRARDLTVSKRSEAMLALSPAAPEPSLWRWITSTRSVHW